MSNLRTVFASVAALQEMPGDQVFIGRRDSQLLYGEEFVIEERQGGWAKGVSTRDGYKGWVRLDLLGEWQNATHAVDSRMTHIYPEPNFKTHPKDMLSFMSRLSISGDAVCGFLPLNKEGSAWVPENHLISLKDMATQPRDIVETAMMFNGAPYVYGGRAAWGLDCSAVIQLAAQRNGIFCPRDTDQQVLMLGEAIEIEEIKRGDLIYFPGHVGIMVDDKNCLNATVRHMQVVIEPLDEMERIYDKGEGDPIIGVRRLEI